MKRIFQQFLQFIQRLWSMLWSTMQSFNNEFLKILRKIRKLLNNMLAETKDHLPEWKKDADDYREEQVSRWNRMKNSYRKEWLDWKKTFRAVDATPEKLHEMLFEDKTKVGTRFEELLIILIIGSVLVVMLDSVVPIKEKIGGLLTLFEWCFTIVFTIEYILRIYSSPHPIRYITSFYGIIDLVTVLPTYIAIVFSQAHTFLILRALRVFRIFRLLKLMKMVHAGRTIQSALQASKAKIFVFLTFILLLVTLMGSVLYIVEAKQGSGFTSIPNSIYWAIVTLTTVGYGDIAPVTWFGRMIAAGVMLTGYAIIAVPTGIVSAEFVKENKKAKIDQEECTKCGKSEHEVGARYCNRCGDRLGSSIISALG